MTSARAAAVCLLVAGAVVGVLLSLVTAFFVPTQVGGVVSLGVVLAVVTIGPYAHYVGRALRSSLAGAVPGLSWFFTTMYFANQRPEGDLVVTGSTAGLLFLLLGTVSATVGIGTVSARVARDDRRALARTVQAEPSGADT